MKIFVKGGGGLGDLIREYLGGEKYWGYLEGIKEKHPDIKIKAILCIHNPQAREFLRYHPCLDKIEQYPWQVDGTPVFFAHSDGYVFIKSIIGLCIGEYKKPKIYLDEEEEIQVETIKNAGKYIVIHPFAGLKDRIAFPIEKYNNLIDEIINIFGYNVIVIGGSYTRMNRDGQEEVSEIFEYTRKGLFNLVGNTNARIATRLIQGASGFIGTHSCYILVASIEKIRSVLLAPERLEVYLNSDDANAKITKNDFTKTIYINNNLEGINQEVIKWLK